MDNCSFAFLSLYSTDEKPEIIHPYANQLYKNGQDGIGRWRYLNAELQKSSDLKMSSSSPSSIENISPLQSYSVPSNATPRTRFLFLLYNYVNQPSLMNATHVRLFFASCPS